MPITLEQIFGFDFLIEELRKEKVIFALFIKSKIIPLKIIKIESSWFMLEKLLKQRCLNFAERLGVVE